MVEWFNTNASAIIAALSALLAAIIAALAAFGGALINNRNSKALRDSQNEIERWKLNRELYLKKAEEVFSLFDSWNEGIHRILSLQTFHAIGVKNQNEVNEEWPSAYDKSLYPRIKALISLYFNELSGDFELISDIYGKSTGRYALFITGKLEKGEFAISVNKSTSEIVSIAERFRARLAELTQKHF
ncbi:Uncharacterised protein [Serratia proteamaculans]|uniref:hypothetical protein n=1 Tax=Serratia proteamaculans TaxID=28151 RepID=UPI0021826AC1|nr:hypothetical protein [Serratia proteamaculans]CAI2399163.1 Uncharacterised protein [Serratia proteamaculans]